MRSLLSCLLLACLILTGCSNQKIAMPSQTVHIDFSKVTVSGNLGPGDAKPTTPSKTK